MNTKDIVLMYERARKRNGVKQKEIEKLRLFNKRLLSGYRPDIYPPKMGKA